MIEEVAQLRAQAREAAKQGDQALIDFVASHPQFFDHEELADLVKKAEEAYDRIEAAKVQAAQQEAAEEETTFTPDTSEQIRANAARVIAQYPGFQEAVAAMVISLDEADVQTAAWVSHTLAEAMKAVGENGKWIFYSWVRDAMREQCHKAADKATPPLLGRLLEKLRLVEEILDRISQVPKGAHSALLQTARRQFDRANKIRFYGWALPAIERMLNGSNNPVTELLRTDRELAEAVAAPEKRRALPLIQAMKARVEKRLIALEKAIEERRRLSAEKSATQAERQRSRIGLGPVGRRGTEEKNYKRKLGPRAAKDPNYRGPNKRKA